MNSDNNFIKKRIMIVGSNGMLGQRVVLLYAEDPNVELLCTSAEDASYMDNMNYRKIDLTDKKNIQKTIREFVPDYIINTAAYTNVDGCETEKELAWKINVTGVEYLAKYAVSSSATVIHISTDYIFDGAEGPYSENDMPNPISNYGRGKLASENALSSSLSSFAIIRTNVLYGPAKYGRPDFVKWVVNSLREKKEIRIVTDQINNPTYIDDLADAINKIIEKRKNGVFNIGGAELISRYDFTLRIADFFQLDKSLIKKIITSDLKQPALRPLKSGLVNLKAETELDYHPRSIETTLELMRVELRL